MLPEGRRQGRCGERPVLGRGGEGSMVPGWVQGKLRGSAGARGLRGAVFAIANTYTAPMSGWVTR